MLDKTNPMYLCWLDYREVKNSRYKEYLKNILVSLQSNDIINNILLELKRALEKAYIEKSITQNIYKEEKDVNVDKYIKIQVKALRTLRKNGYEIRRNFLDENKSYISVTGYDINGVLYGVFHLLRLLEENKEITEEPIIENPENELRLINQWDNIDGTVERGFAGSSIFFESVRNNNKIKEIMKVIGIPASSDLIREAFNDEYRLSEDLNRINDYARLLASIGINGIVVNNTNVHKEETYFIDKKIDMIKTINDIMSKWGVKVYLSINFAAPITLKELNTADPLDEEVIKWWEKRVNYVYDNIDNLGGFMVKADSEGRPGPFTYGRNHADGANMLARALKPYGGILIWRCFVYNCKQDWRDYSIDRAKAAYECFNPLDGEFVDNVYLQIKNGPMDFQVREPISPLFGAMNNTNKILELQITQEYTGQQRDICFLVPWWKEILEFNTYSNTENSMVKDRIRGVAAISNIGSDLNWTGNFLAQANLYGYGRLIWNSKITSEEIVDEWVTLTLGKEEKVMSNIKFILLNSWRAYEDYTAPLGIGWMVSPGHHYGPDIDGYEYSPWGTYNRATCEGIGIDRSISSGTRYIEQYKSPLKEVYEDMSTCPDELLLFFHHVKYNHKLKSGKTVIQHIYDSHFEGYDLVVEFIDRLDKIKEIIDEDIYSHLKMKANEQLENAREWKDRVNTYFYRISGISDEKNRKIY
ncbi:alpha-glucuronidase family glycosyl hydrolase [Clostridium sp. AL.422]|uniref:alpha-glucuronidase family glycosyl hydrolase n=1 Tax=Clostridium TaxID=1485 RepID=UPI00293DBB5F|nr:MULTISPECIES: alpha-glucuronidase family glycosyl hydrolase [unclassified Clostridium]MDV4151046.1 alpha-glucuronidase family glycosyl hydrolase [Clostridium sp. AL.422]